MVIVRGRNAALGGAIRRELRAPVKQKIHAFSPVLTGRVARSEGKIDQDDLFCRRVNKWRDKREATG